MPEHIPTWQETIPKQKFKPINAKKITQNSDTHKKKPLSATINLCQKGSLGHIFLLKDSLGRIFLLCIDGNDLL